ncbi:hypothetical protein P0W64_15025 [Tsukamurella sp. 8F]|uniref:hypothetical protein n=1 Tax=unclassified Tsukamurella TaxID=2633480 RepID=UPI0023B8DCE9|nr:MULTISPECIES: hypothetical protein [unclassified Tsukamurella]MDF0532205.1 hypothetical protein [Tsukamurella sp. 8J]MDF0588090.1 hypothetical protein [Tsukamurella sp. 8F]
MTTMTEPQVRAAVERVRRQQRLALAYHEAGHAVAAVLLGGQGISARLRDDDLEGETAMSHLDEHRQPDVGWAGPYAEARFRRGRRPGYYEVRNLLDQNPHDEALIAAAGPAPDFAYVEQVVDRCWPAISRVARALASAGEVDHGGVLFALGAYGSRRKTSHTLALVRSGWAPGELKVSVRTL